MKRRTQGKVRRPGNIQLIIVELKRLKIQKNKQAIQLIEVWAEKVIMRRLVANQEELTDLHGDEMLEDETCFEVF